MITGDQNASNPFHANGPERVRKAIAPGSNISAVHAYSGEMLSFGPFDTVVVADHGRADDDLYHALRAARAAPEVLRAGDCVAPRRAGNAIVEGHRVGRAL